MPMMKSCVYIRMLPVVYGKRSERARKRWKNTFQSEVVDLCLQQVEPGVRPYTAMVRVHGSQGQLDRGEEKRAQCNMMRRVQQACGSAIAVQNNPLIFFY